MDEILITAGDLKLEVNEDDIEELIMGHEDELTTEELQEILNEKHLETQLNVSPSEQDEDERGPMPTSAIKDLLKKWADCNFQQLFHVRPKVTGKPKIRDIWRISDLEGEKDFTDDHREEIIVIFVQEVSNPVDDETDENEDNNSNESS
ncbi:uncharacterized protein TNCV_4113551 [Trichonephila clavipes]|nr:uncharacterized protein TNCV_4113551 [Trichonephila clavipes]